MPVEAFHLAMPQRPKPFNPPSTATFKPKVCFNPKEHPCHKRQTRVAFAAMALRWLAAAALPAAAAAAASCAAEGANQTVPIGLF